MATLSHHCRGSSSAQPLWGDAALIANGDTFLAEDWRELAATHKTSGLPVTMALVRQDDCARFIADQLGVDRVYAKLLPQEKSRILEELREEFGPVAMVGDGVNDAPALVTADVGIALGAAGTDVALETADVVVMGDDLGGIPYARTLSLRARRIVLQNLVFASGVILVLVTLAILGSISLPAGVVGHEGSTIVVVFNGLRLLRGRRKTPEASHGPPAGGPPA